MQLALPTADGAEPGVERHEFNFGMFLVEDSNLPGYTYTTRIAGSVHYPAEGAGPFPVVLFMHGRHGTCEVLGIEGFGLQQLCFNIPPFTATIDSFAGYDYLAEDLAARGFVVISANANDINDRDLPGSVGLGLGDGGARARGQLIMRLLEEFQDLNSVACSCSVGSDLIGRQDFSRVGLMGHSRGGEGVTHAIGLNAARASPFGLRAVMAVAPTDFNSQQAPGVAHATILAYCDGDVYDLQGASVYDSSRFLSESPPSPKYQFLVMGANHNFYNTVWTTDDAAITSDTGDDPYCGAAEGSHGFGSGRLGPADQRRTGLVLINGFFRLHLTGDSTYATVLTGQAPMPAEGCPGGVAPCDVLHASYHAPAGARLVVEDTLDRSTITSNDLGGASTFTGFTVRTTCDPADCTSQPNVGSAHQLALFWDGPATWSTVIPAASGDVSGFDVVSFRLGVNYQNARNPNGQHQDLRLVLTDGVGASASVRVGDHSAALFDPPGNSAAKVVLNMVQVPMGAFAGVDTTDVASIELVFDQTPTGSVQITDLMFQEVP